MSNFLLTIFTMALTVYVAPAAAGSGIPEVKAYLNGVDAPQDILSRDSACEDNTDAPFAECVKNLDYPNQET